MYVVGISNVVGLEAWNSYTSSYPRNLRLITSVNMTAILTNELGFGTMIYSNKTGLVRTMDIPANTWKGWTVPNTAPYSMQIPLTNAFSFLTNSTYIPRPPWFLPQTHEFERGTSFYVPRWWLKLNTRLQFILLDTTVQPNRIVDYVNLNNWESTVDITTKLTEGNTGPINPGDYRNIANQWLTNHLANNINAPTYGIINQIQVGLNGTTDWLSFSQDPYSGQDAESAVDGFRYNLLDPPGSPIYPKDAGKLFYRSNVFYAPFAPYRPIYVHTAWQANDPLVHYTIGDLIDPLNFIDTNRVNFTQLGTANIGQINGRYRPWGGNPKKNDPLTDTQMAVKDPFVTRSDDWDFPANKYPNIGWLGRVHRGTPWQTVFLKSTNTMQMVGGPKGFAQSLLNWQLWTGNPITIGNPVLTNMVSSNLVVSLVGTNINARLARRGVYLARQTIGTSWICLRPPSTTTLGVASSPLTKPTWRRGRPCWAELACCRMRPPSIHRPSSIRQERTRVSKGLSTASTTLERTSPITLSRGWEMFWPPRSSRWPPPTCWPLTGRRFSTMPWWNGSRSRFSGYCTEVSNRRVT